MIHRLFKKSWFIIGWAVLLAALAAWQVNHGSFAQGMLAGLVIGWML
ncbi:MAG: hypothetical protein ACLP7A_13340 [Desulfobaccales bacterium]